MISDTSTFFPVLLAAAAAPLISAGATRLLPMIVVPIAVVELALGAVIGPHGFRLSHVDPALQVMGTLGLGFLFFFAGYELDFKQMRGAPLRLAAVGWGISLALAYSIAGVFAATGFVISGLLTGSAMSTTAIGTILPVLRDTDQLEGRFGPSMLAAGAVGELGPVMIVTLLLSASASKVSQALILGIFIVATIVAALVSSGAAGRAKGFLGESLNTSGQLPVRLTVVLVFALVVLADSLGLDVILGAFAAGLMVRFVLHGRTNQRFESKLDAVGFGFLIPFFFIESGMNLDLSALTSSVEAILKVPLFVACFFLVRGLPALLLYTRELNLRDRLGMALFSSTQLPLVVAITTLGIEQGKMKQTTAVALVTAGVISVLVFPTAAIIVRRVGRPATSEEAALPEPDLELA
ncbi:MAG: cation:proton antiporter [Solirubrobacterales bacterium]|nr:cation:proton antiporter [Solirubrobacterales bacterium]